VNTGAGRLGMTSSDTADWLVPAGLVTLSAIPTVAGVFRVLQLAGGVEVTLDSARFFVAPLPVVLHVLSTVIFCVLGAFRFSPGLRRRNPDWHRGVGRTLVPCGLVAALAGVWMTHLYAPGIDAPESFNGLLADAIRVVAGSAMAFALVLGFAAIRGRDIPPHRTWMLRGCALGLGAGALAVTHLPWYLLPDIQGELARTLLIAAGWGLNLAVAEWAISRERRTQSCCRRRRPITCPAVPNCHAQVPGSRLDAAPF
jgi:uncharacterized membrane protein YozB (DUF420 family)